jgi:hypothetical protein
MPTRVVDVGVRGGQQDPILFVPPLGYRESYIALSYCWGNPDSRFVLTKEKALLTKPQFPFKSLPKTLQDAVRITQKLGFRFLWVDALCIIQDGDGGEDFLRESVTMQHVYGNAALTIAAAAAADVQEGIFQQPTSGRHSKCEVPYDMPDGVVGKAFITFEENLEGGIRINEPLNTRGWTFQERLLSPRNVVFYKDQISWDCTSTLINSNGPLNPLINYNVDSPGRYSDYIAINEHAFSIEATERYKYMAYWRTLIEFYSRRELTNTNDKLKAIVGLAQLIKSKTGDQYMAGLWRSDIQIQLLWYTDDPSSKRSGDFRAPSWSWASIDGPVKFRQKDSLSFQNPEYELDFEPANDEFGLILRAYLMVKGRLYLWEVPNEAVKQQLRKREMWSSQWKDLSELANQCGFFFDQMIDEQNFFSGESQPEFFLCFPQSSASAAIIIQKNDEVYKRVGVYITQAKFGGGSSWDMWLGEHFLTGSSAIATVKIA